ncbi:unnamed protein product [Enterobius vermicularis]|uniref:MMS19 nucleotide excision repair protein n=1 Tax=Enterobius vermicularis TaxID=51028 RepID=A0A0N4V4J4_ENTVE|nr:unnamed protein product [Enterobius vermicularis]
MPTEASLSAIPELVQFLNAETSPEIRHSAIAYIVGISATAEDEFVPTGFAAHNFSLTKSFCALFETVPSDQPALYSGFINITSDDPLTANFVIEHSSVISISTVHCKNQDSLASDAAKLLSNLSLHFSSKVLNIVAKEWPAFLTDTIDLLNAKDSADFADYLGYVLVNCTELPKIRREVCDHVKNLLPLISLKNRPKRRLIAVDIVRNLCFDDDNKILENILLKKRGKQSTYSFGFRRKLLPLLFKETTPAKLERGRQVMAKIRYGMFDDCNCDRVDDDDLIVIVEKRVKILVGHNAGFV